MICPFLLNFLMKEKFKSIRIIHNHFSLNNIDHSLDHLKISFSLIPEYNLIYLEFPSLLLMIYLFLLNYLKY